MKNPFTRSKMQHPDGLDSTFYVQGFVFSGGAESLAYVNTRPHPIEGIPAGIQVKRQLRVTTPQVVYQMLALPVQPILPGFVAGQQYTAPLTSQPNSFGGVQS